MKPSLPHRKYPLNSRVRLTLALLLALLWMPSAQASSPELKTEIKGAFEDGVIDGDYLYLAARAADDLAPDLLIYQKETQGHYAEIGRYRSKEYAHSLVLKEQHLYLADGEHGLEIISIKTPATPVLVATQYLKGYSHKVVIRNQHAFVASGYGGLHIIDIATPDQPKLISTYQAYPSPIEWDNPDTQASDDDSLFGRGGESNANAGGAEALYYDDDDEDYGGEVEIEPANLYREEGALDLTIDNNLVHLAYGSAGLITVDVNNLSQPTEVAQLQLERTAESVSQHGDTLYVLTGIMGVAAVDVNQPAQPALLNQTRTSCYPMDLTTYHSKIYIADGFCGPNGLYVIDTHKPKQLNVSEKLAGKMGSVAVSEGQLLVFEQAQVKIYGVK